MINKLLSESIWWQGVDGYRLVGSDRLLFDEIYKSIQMSAFWMIDGLRCGE